MPAALVEPHGGELKDLYLSGEDLRLEREASREYHAWNLTPRQLCDIELILNGAFSPLSGFMQHDDYVRVCQEGRLVDGTLWTIPITLDVSTEFASKVTSGEKIALYDREGVLIAVMTVGDVWRTDKEFETSLVYGANGDECPGVVYLHHNSGEYYIGGQLRGINMPAHYDFPHIRHTPAELRQRFNENGWTRVVAFHTNKPMHRARQEQVFHAAQQLDANLLIHPVVGTNKLGEFDYYSRVRCYEYILPHFSEQTTTLSLLPLAMRMAGPREVLLHAIVSKNYGCTHVIVDHNYTDLSDKSLGKDARLSHQALELLRMHENELGIRMVTCENVVYVENMAQYVPISQVSQQDTVLDMSDKELCRRLYEGVDIPEWYSFPEVIQELRKAYPPRNAQGFTLFFTGLSGAGKSTLANAITLKLMEMGDRRVTLLDGDIVRKNLSSELGFSKQHRDINVMRIGFVAQEITKHGGVAVCAPIAPYSLTRHKIRDAIEQVGGFIEVYVSTPITICESRDRKGLYAKARAGLLKDFTGVDDPYEIPEHAELSIDTSILTVEESIQMIILKLKNMGYIR